MARLIESADIADGFAATLADGRSWGPFESQLEADAWGGLFMRDPSSLATAREIYEGSVSGDGFHLVDDVAAGLDMHPFAEVHDWYTEHDNGRVIAAMPRGVRAVDPDEAVSVLTPIRGERTRRLPPPAALPPRVDLQGSPLAAFQCTSGGEIVTAREKGFFIVCWRPDQRHRKDLQALSLHTVERMGIDAARSAAVRFRPAARPRGSTRPRDYQVSRVYRWERGIERDRSRFDTLAECIRFAAEMCDDLGVPCPEISMGRSTLENHSFFSPARGIVLQSGMKHSDVVLHELAHYVVSLDRRCREPGHGPRFAGVLAGMLARFKGADLDSAIDAARAEGVDIDEEAARSLAPAARGYGAAT